MAGSKQSLASRTRVKCCFVHPVVNLQKVYIQSGSGRKVNILGGGSMDYSE